MICIRLQDILSTKRKIFRETKTEFKVKNTVLQDEIEKLKQDIERHDKKADRFAEIQEKTFKELWEFSQEQINKYLEKVSIYFEKDFSLIKITCIFKIFKIDEIIYKTQLGIDWKLPQQLKYLDVSKLPSYKKNSNTPSAEVMKESMYELRIKINILTLRCVQSSVCKVVRYIIQIT